MTQWKHTIYLQEALSLSDLEVLASLLPEIAFPTWRQPSFCHKVPCQQPINRTTETMTMF